jgi:putative aminopeptidase FrvX
MESLSDKCWQDDSGNIIAVRKGKSDQPSLGIITHKDELGLIVKRIEGEGRVRIETTSSARPWIYGEGPVDLLGDQATVTGVLSFGSRHVGEESNSVHPGRDGNAPKWSNCWVTTGLTKEQLAERGVAIGTKAVIGRHRKTPLLMGDYIGGYALDCKAAVAIVLGVMEAVRNVSLARTVHFLITSQEEPGVLGGLFAARSLELQRLTAVEVGPVAAEYETRNCERPILLYMDVAAQYDEEGNRALLGAAEHAGVGVQRAVLTSFGSDASFAFKQGLISRANCICYPTENTHGYEVSSLRGIENTMRVLARFVENECGG